MPHFQTMATQQIRYENFPTGIAGEPGTPRLVGHRGKWVSGHRFEPWNGCGRTTPASRRQKAPGVTASRPLTGRLRFVVPGSHRNDGVKLRHRNKKLLFNIGRRDSLQNQPSINRTNNRVGVPGVVAAAVVALPLSCAVFQRIIRAERPDIVTCTAAF